MTRNEGKETTRLSLTELLKALKYEKKIAVVGYALSAESAIPQFEAILNGVWSGSPQNINPFDDNDGRDTVLGWLGWRMQLIGKKDHCAFFQACHDLKSALKLSLLATQAVDGQLRSGGVQDVKELYGNIFEGRCVRCGVSNGSLSPKMIAPGHVPKCNACGGNVFPDVTMFGWNQKLEALQEVLSAYRRADTAILIGIDSSLAPFSLENSSSAAPNYILNVHPKAFVLSSRSHIQKATAEELADDFDKKHGKRLAPPNTQNIHGNLKFLVTLVQTSERCANEVD